MSLTQETQIQKNKNKNLGRHVPYLQNYKLKKSFVNKGDARASF